VTFNIFSEKPTKHAKGGESRLGHRSPTAAQSSTRLMPTKKYQLIREDHLNEF